MHLQALMRFYRDKGTLEKVAPMSWRCRGLFAVAALAAFGGSLSWALQPAGPMAVVVLGAVAVPFFLLSIRSRNLELSVAAERPVASFSDRVAAIAQLQHDRLLDFLRDRGQATLDQVDRLMEAAKYALERAEKRSLNVRWALKIVVTLLAGLALIITRSLVGTGNIEGAVDLIGGAVAITLMLMGLWITAGATLRDFMFSDQRDLGRLIALLYDVRITLGAD